MLTKKELECKSKHTGHKQQDCLKDVRDDSKVTSPLAVPKN